VTPFAIVRQSLQENRPGRSWRESLRARLPADKLHEILADLAEGKAWMAMLPDGRCSAPVMPSSDVRLRAATFLHEALYGKAVAQTEIQKAEQEAKEFEAIRALSDDELEAAASQVLEARRVERLTPGEMGTAEFVVEKELQPADLARSIWESSTQESDP
jgi:hypothetical protein